MVHTNKDCCKILLLQLEQIEKSVEIMKVYAAKFDDATYGLVDTQDLEREVYLLTGKLEEFDNENP